ncbi:hypothetical protein KKG52_01285 [Patescibacteria group bacterium]|nr:hypothetical protein [Patescibacteria group bacterium]
MAKIKKKPKKFSKAKEKPIKKENKEGKAQSQKFPNIFRFIPEIKLNSFFIVLSFVFLVVFIVILGIDIVGKLEKRKITINQRVKIETEISSWENIAKKYPGYKDAYLQIGILNYRKQDFKQARKFIDKSLFLDPDFNGALIMKSKIGN